MVPMKWVWGYLLCGLCEGGPGWLLTLWEAFDFDVPYPSLIPRHRSSY